MTRAMSLSLTSRPLCFLKEGGRGGVEGPRVPGGGAPSELDPPHAAGVTDGHRPLLLSVVGERPVLRKDSLATELGGGVGWGETGSRETS